MYDGIDKLGSAVHGQRYSPGTTSRGSVPVGQGTGSAISRGVKREINVGKNICPQLKK
jgi:hypothetical protein